MTSDDAPTGASTNGSPRVRTLHGWVRGAQLGKHGGAFYLVPYAQAPIGQLRFNRSQPPHLWTHVLDVSKPPSGRTAACLQYDVSHPGHMAGVEDCLQLFIYTPHIKPAAGFPVMYFIHGGSWHSGDGYEDGRYDGAQLALGYNVVVVSVQYRLGPLGFLALPELKWIDGSVGNNAFLDQRHGLHWVRSNIANFGGDPSKVTIFGSGSGGSSVCWHLASPGSRGLFRAAIVQSGHCGLRSEVAETAMQRWSHAASSVGCVNGTDRMECLRKLPHGGLRYASKMFDPAIFGIVVDGVESNLPAEPMRLIAEGKGSIVPLIVGSNQLEFQWGCKAGEPHEHCPFLLGNLLWQSPRGFVEGMFARAFDQRQWDLVEAHYQHINLIGNASRWSSIVTDASWHDSNFQHGGSAWSGQCDALGLASAMSTSEHGQRPVWIYEYAFGSHHGTAGQHGDEVPYVFGTCEQLKAGANYFQQPCDSTSLAMLQLSQIFARYWTNFAKSLDPNADGDAFPVVKGADHADLSPVLQVRWKPGQKQALRISSLGESKGSPARDINVRMTAPSREEHCKFWNSLLSDVGPNGGDLDQNQQLKARCSTDPAYRWCDVSATCVQIRSERDCMANAHQEVAAKAENDSPSHIHAHVEEAVGIQVGSSNTDMLRTAICGLAITLWLVGGFSLATLLARRKPKSSAFTGYDLSSRSPLR